MGLRTITGLLASMPDGETTSPVSSHLDMRLTGFDRGRATYEMTVTDNLTNAVGVLLGGIASVLAHATMAAGSMTILDDDQIKTRTACGNGTVPQTANTASGSCSDTGLADISRGVRGFGHG